MSENSTFFRRGSIVLVAEDVAGFGAYYVLNIGLTRLLSSHDYGCKKQDRH